MKKDLISIIIPYHKKKIYFQDTINCIIKQTYVNFELIVIYDDQDKSELKHVRKVLNKFNKFKCKKIKLIVNKKNIGAGLSRNKAIKLAKGNYIAFCDADDLWNNKKLEIQLKFMKDNQFSFSHTSYNIINEKGKKISDFSIKKKIKYSDLLKSCDIGLSTVMCSKKILQNKKFLNIKTKEDYYLWLSIIMKQKHLYGIQKKLTSWRRLDLSLSSSILRKVLDAFYMYNKHTNKNVFLSVFYTLRLTFYAFMKKIKIYV